jgi:hypothetical protein
MTRTKRHLAAALIVLAAGAFALTAALLRGASPDRATAASHREAPLISLDPTADITDFFFFRSYETGKSSKAVLIMDVIPGEEPSSGPNYWNFDPSVLYRFHVDNNADGEADEIEFEIRFENEFRGTAAQLGLFLPYVALPPITALDGAGSEGLGLRQKYSVTMVKGGKKHKKPVRTLLGSGLIAAPSNVGPRTMPNYPALAAQALYNLPGGIRVFAGQRQDPFYIDLGATFDTLNFRRAPLPLETVAEDANDNANAFGVDQLSGFNVHTIALEVPISLLNGDTGASVLGAYASTSRQSVKVRGHEKEKDWVQVQRLANPLVNETIIGTGDKDRWNATGPEDEAAFLDYYLNPRLALALQVVFGVPAATSNRTDLRNLLLTYGSAGDRLSELLRLNVGVAPTPLSSQKRLGPLAHDAANNPTPDPAAWPNGRRPIDDVTDVAVRVVGGPNYIAALAADGINHDDAALPGGFPFLATPADGVNRVHQN